MPPTSAPSPRPERAREVTQGRSRGLRLLLAALALVGCGGSVYLGGTSDGGGDSATAPPIDAAPFDRCDATVGPSVDAGCRACFKGDEGCQPNGCYGGFWCNTATRDCHTPLTHCP